MDTVTTTEATMPFSKEKRSSIALKINLIVLVVMLLLGGSLGTFFIVERHRELEEELARRIQLFGLYLARSVEGADPETRQLIIESAVPDKEIAYILIKSTTGDILAARWEAQTRGNIEEHIFPIKGGRHGTQTVFGPLESAPNGEVIANLAIGVDLSGITAAKQAMYPRTFSIVALAALLAAGIGFIFIRLLLRRKLAPLLAGIEQFGSGNLSHRVPEVDGSELGQIGAAFNQMTRQLAAREQALRESERNYREIFNAARDAILLYDPESERVVETNTAVESLFGLTAAEAREITLHDVVSGEPPYTVQDAAQLMRKTLQEGPQTFEWLARNRNGEPFWMEVDLTPTEIGGAGRILAVMRDISERKKTEELAQQLIQSQKMESLGRLAGGIAHDFNNLLTPIIGYSELIKVKLTDPALQEKADRILSAADRARDLVQQILGFGRKQILEMKALDLNLVVDSFHHIMRRTIRENIAIRVHLTPEKCIIHGDRSQLEQIIMNLMVNAQDAIDGAGTITIETAQILLDEEYVRQHVTARPGRYVVLSVTDDGHGMDKETQQKVFEPFFTTKELGHGTGLGLATVHGIVNQHRGQIWVYSEPGKGTTFKIYLPLTTETAAEETVAPPKSPEAPWESMTILLVEDDDNVRNLVQELLAGFGFRVITAEGPRQALALKVESPIHLLLTDVVMPDMNGPELCSRLRERYPELKAVFMSGYTNNVIVHHGVLDPDINFIQKPFSAHNLAQKIESALASAPPSTHPSPAEPSPAKPVAT